MRTTARLFGIVQTALVLCAVAVVCPVSAVAQTSLDRPGSIDGVVTTQRNTIALGGASVVVRGSTDRDVATIWTESDGRFHVAGLPAGTYTVVVSLDGFTTSTTMAMVSANGASRVAVDLEIAAIAASVDVVAPETVVSSAETLAKTDGVSAAESDRFSPGGGLQAALRLLASVIEGPGGLSIKGGRPTQAATQIGPGSLVEPSIGLSHFTLPGDAIDSIAVLPNPYAVEYGRFSSGLVVIQTRRAGDDWHLRFDDLDPSFRGVRGKDLYTIKGIGSIAPQVEFGGPIVKDRLFLEQTVQGWYSANSVLSRSEDELQTRRALSSFSRVDANLSPVHSVVITAGLQPSASTDAMLGTFTPPEATVSLNESVSHVAATERALWSDHLVGETTVQTDAYRINVLPHGDQPLVISPDTRSGNYYNVQSRSPVTYQWIETLSGSADSRIGLHLFKVGVDVLHSDYRGSSLSRPILIDREDGTLARRFDFSGLAVQSLQTTDVALFAQDRLQANRRWFLEYGARLDRDGVFDRWNLTPRVGAAVLLNDAGTQVLRGGIGLFYERTPSAAGEFGQFESFTDARFGPDGVSPIGAPVVFTHVTSADPHTARSLTLDATYDYRWNKKWALQLSALNRQGSHELIVDTEQRGDQGALVLSTNGRSEYREVSATLHFTPSVGTALHVTYTRSAARSDTNPFSTFFDTFMWPIVPPNAYAAAGSDVPNRLLARGEYMPTRRWLLIGTLDWRTGLPYSPFDESLDFVGPRNALRMPSPLRVDLGVERRFHIKRFQPWIGVRAYNAFDAFLPSDVQANTGSPSFGSFYNSPYRELRLQFRFER